MSQQRFALAPTLALVTAVALPGLGAAPAMAQTAVQNEGYVPVTDAMLQDPSPDDWLMWRRTLNGWGYSPLDQIDRENVGELQMVWTRALAPGAQEGTPLAYDGTLYMPNPNEVVQAIDAVTGDLKWEYRRDIPDDVAEIMGGLTESNRNIAIYGNLIIDTSNDDYIYALDVQTGELVWEEQIFDYRVHPGRAGLLRHSCPRHRHRGGVVARATDSSTRRAGRRDLTGGRLQSVDQHHVLPASADLCVSPGRTIRAAARDRPTRQRPGDFRRDWRDELVA